MERVLGIGGYFLRAADPAALSSWYRDCLGLDADANGLWPQEAGPTVFATFESETEYFGARTQQSMLNFRVRDLNAMLAQLRARGADVAEESQDIEGGRPVRLGHRPRGQSDRTVAARLTAPSRRR
ncbi:VOC family protein [Streptomyces sp. H27-G5]|nr:VOC family protein [Streptomyces sp. H27-G5]